MEKLGICGRLTDSPATGTGRFGTLGIWRFTFGRFTLGRLLVKLLQKQTKKKQKKFYNSGRVECCKKSNVRHTVQKRETEKWKKTIFTHKEQTHKKLVINVGRESIAHLKQKT